MKKLKRLYLSDETDMDLFNSWGMDEDEDEYEDEDCYKAKQP